MIRLTHKFNAINLIVQAIITLFSLGLYFITSFFLENSYARSNFPVPYFEQQTSFNADKMKEWYAHMIESETFDIYLQTQFIDFAFIAAVIMAGFCLWSLVSNLHPDQNFFYRHGKKMAFSLPMAGFFDILENLVSFFMIANPEDFHHALVIPYSSFAVLKFACWVIGLIWLIISLLALPITRIRHHYKKA